MQYGDGWLPILGIPYTQNINGCYLSNFKPQRGNISLMEIFIRNCCSLSPPNFGLLDMAGNAAEWCEDAFDKSAVNLPMI